MSDNKNMKCYSHNARMMLHYNGIMHYFCRLKRGLNPVDLRRWCKPCFSKGSNR